MQSTVSLPFITQLKRYQFDFRIPLKLITSIVFHFSLRFFYRPSFNQNNDNYVHSLILYQGLHTVFCFCLRRKGGGGGGGVEFFVCLFCFLQRPTGKALVNLDCIDVYIGRLIENVIAVTNIIHV